MDWHDGAVRANKERAQAWLRKLDHDARHGDLTRWLSGFRAGMPCELEGDRAGSFNRLLRFRFSDGVRWMLRMPIPGLVMDCDEKMAHEVATMRFVRDHTSIPVPAVRAWGMSRDNPLGLGPFILMDFVQGHRLRDLLKHDPKVKPLVTRADVSEGQWKTIYRQMARILLELSRHSFLLIGSLSETEEGRFVVETRPLTIKSQEIESHGGVDVKCDKSQTFSSAADYFYHISDQDLRHLSEQPNSADDEADAAAKLRRWSIFRALIPRFAAPRHDKEPFTLVCDDFQFGNILVDNTRDLRFVAVLDWEWAYAGPYQLLYSPHRCLLLHRPNDWDGVEDQFLAQYVARLGEFVRVLREEEEEEEGGRETKAPGPRLSSLMARCMEDGTFWFHEIAHTIFGGPNDLAWRELEKLIPNLDSLSTVSDCEVKSFVAMKMEHLKQYRLSLQQGNGANTEKRPKPKTRVKTGH